MKQITEPKRVQRATRCDGPNEWFTDTDYEIEASDVNSRRDNYLGYQHRTYQFTSSDVGRKVRFTRQSGYECWYFLSNPQL